MPGEVENLREKKEQPEVSKKDSQEKRRNEMESEGTGSAQSRQSARLFSPVVRIGSPRPLSAS
jgi:hypothetical protein